MDFSKIIGGAKAKADKMLQDFNKALPIMKDLGLSVSKVGVDMGILPSVRANLRGSMDSVNKDRILQLMTEHSQNKFVMTILKGLQTAANVQSVVKGIPFKGVDVRLKLGILPNVDVDFIRDGAAAVAATPKNLENTETSKEIEAEVNEAA